MVSDLAEDHGKLKRLLKCFALMQNFPTFCNVVLHQFDITLEKVCFFLFLLSFVVPRFWGRLRFPKDYPFRPPSILMAAWLRSAFFSSSEEKAVKKFLKLR